MKKHAYLIKAHHQFDLLKKLLKLLDDERNDIYIHIGRRNIPKDEFEKCVGKSGVFWVPATKEAWGGYSQIRSELALFKCAAAQEYDYYHLLSGSDLPIKTQDEIHSFFDKYKGKEFIHFSPKNICENSRHKYDQYHFFQEKIGKRQDGVIYKAERFLLFAQKRIGIHRADNDIQYCMGANWVSITHKLVQFILINQAKIRKWFHASLCCDEFFIQTLVWNSELKKNVFSLEDDYMACLRLIDWERGNPYVWRINDYEELIHAPHLFARKFDETVDFEIIDKMYRYIEEKQRKSKDNIG